MLPNLQGSFIQLAGAQINIDHCQVNELQALLGKPTVIIGPANIKMLSFDWQFGIINAFPGQVEKLCPSTQIQLLHFVLDQEIALPDIISWYQCEPAYYFIESDSGLEHYAIFSLRMQVKFYPENSLVKVIGFVNQDHVLNCTCPECCLIRDQVKTVKKLERVITQLH
ncbi:MAG: hypothetical protein GF365_04805 [Candidatus Buchananbacteria bacterium]|nr:hypothetical protein [Candidatus Buchananbacteria bacterium]